MRLLLLRACVTLVLFSIPTILFAQSGEFPTYTATSNYFTTNTLADASGIPSGLAAKFSYRVTPAFGDLDLDGDLDMVVGQDDGTFRYFVNNGSATSANLQRFGTVVGPGSGADPFAGLDALSAAAPAFGDFDGDGDLDMVVGTRNGPRLFYYENTTTVGGGGGGSAKRAASFTVDFAQPATNPFAGINQGFLAGRDNSENVHPAVGDFDGDGDLDLVIGVSDPGTTLSDAVFRFVENTGTATAPSFALLTGASNPIFGIDLSPTRGFGWPEAVDWDDDGDLDLVIATAPTGANGSDQFATRIMLAQNTGTATQASFSNLVEVAAQGLPSARPDGYRAVALADLDADSDLDLLWVNADGTSADLFIGEKEKLESSFARVTGGDNPFGSIDFGDQGNDLRSPDVADIDGDGDYDILVNVVRRGSSAGSRPAGLYFYANTGSATAPQFTEQSGANDPFGGIGISEVSQPGFGDLDADGDIDLMMGRNDGSFAYFRNDGDATTPNYMLVVAANPFGGLTGGSEARIDFEDLDADGDLDAAVGTAAGGVRYYRNDGNAKEPEFVQATGAANPFFGIAGPPGATTGELGDIDSDGDLDLFFGPSAVGGTFRYFENVGTATAPSFVERTGTGNPAPGPYGTEPTANGGLRASLVDLDRDGDLDVVTGETEPGVGSAPNPSEVFFLENTSQLLPVELSSFTAALYRGRATLAWATISETNNHGFHVEMRSDSDASRGFATLGFVAGSGTTLEAQRYSFTTEALETGTYTFRLRQVDYDGAFEYSPEVEVAVGLEGTYELGAATPNPFRSRAEVRLAVSAGQTVRASLYDALGREVAHVFEGDLGAGASIRLRVDGSGLGAGLYLLRVEGERFVATRRVVLVR